MLLIISKRTTLLCSRLAAVINMAEALVAGGSGIVPLMSMLRHRAAAKIATPTLLLYSSRTFEDIIYREELDQMVARNDGLTVIYIR